MGDFNHFKASTMGMLPSLAGLSLDSDDEEERTPRQHSHVEVRRIARDDCPAWGIDAVRKLGYELKEIVSFNAPTVVRQAACRLDGQNVAVKCICSTDDKVRQSMRAEFELLKRLSHVHIVQVKAFYESHFDIWLFMEWCSGGSMTNYVQQHGAFKEAVGVGLFIHLLSGVDYLHGKLLVHGNLEPTNLLVKELSAARSQRAASSSGTPGLLLKITGFKSATRVRRRPASPSATSLARVNWQYRAPDATLTDRMDVWSCGICLYFMLKQSLPFDATDSAVQEVLRAGNLPEVNWGPMSDAVRNLVSQCLTVRMQDRPTAMESLLHPALQVPTAGQGSLPAATDAEGSKAAARGAGFSSTLNLPSSGLLSVWVQPGVSLAPSKVRHVALHGDMLPATVDEGAPATAADGSWRERRGGVDSLLRLAANRYRRTTADARRTTEPVDEVKKNRFRRYFSTHGALQTAVASGLTEET